VTIEGGLPRILGEAWKVLNDVTIAAKEKNKAQSVHNLGREGDAA
jgi:hypothetical protein